MINAIIKKFRVGKVTAEEYLEQLAEDGISTPADLENTSVYICPDCGAAVVVGECETDRYWTNNGDRCITHTCYYCGGTLEDIDLEKGCETLPE